MRLHLELYTILLAGLACSGSTSPTSYSGGGGGNMPPSGSVVDVTMQDYSFTQAPTVKVGTTVRWTNNGPSAHTTTSDAGVWDSGSLSAPSGGGGYGGSTSGGTYSHVFSTAGTYAYHCTFHGASNGMKGTITVTP